MSANRSTGWPTQALLWLEWGMFTHRTLSSVWHHIVFGTCLWRATFFVLHRTQFAESNVQGFARPLCKKAQLQELHSGLPWQASGTASPCIRSLQWHHMISSRIPTSDMHGMWAPGRTVLLHAWRHSVHRRYMSSPAFRGQDDTSVAVANGSPDARDSSGFLAGPMARFVEVHTEVHTHLPNTLILPD